MKNLLYYFAKTRNKFRKILKCKGSIKQLDKFNHYLTSFIAFLVFTFVIIACNVRFPKIIPDSLIIPFKLLG